MTRREGTSKSNSVDARRRFAAKTNVAQIIDSHRKINIACDLPVRFGSKQVKVTRREGTSKSIFVVATGHSVTNKGGTQM